MKIRACFLIIVLSALSFCAISQSEPYVLIDKVKADQMAVDKQGNVYAIQGSNLYKYDPTGKLLYSFSDYAAGVISSIDVTNPLKVMLFYQDVAEIRFLDDRLAPIAKLSLMDLGYYTVSLAAYSIQNSLWLYDNVQRELICVDFQGKEKCRNHLVLPDFAPTQLFCYKEQNVVLYNPNSGVAFFDVFGTLLKTLPFVSETPVQVVGGALYFTKEGQLCAFDLNKLELFNKPLHEERIKQFYLSRGNLYLLTEEGLIKVVSL